jgi:mono/diheme cytochrome c family protein
MNTTGSTMQMAWRATAGAAMLLTSAGALVGCRGERSEKAPRQFLPDMDDSPKWKAQVESQFFEDGRTMRPKVPGTVAFGDSERLDDPSRARYARENDGFYSGTSGFDAKGEPVFLDSIPLSGFDGWPAEAGEGESPTEFLTRREAFMGSIIQRGQERFNIYCSACHGYAGDGQGMVGVRWSTPVANFHDPKYVDQNVAQGKDGYIFNVIRWGVPFPNPKNEPLRMPAYAHSVNEQDAWSIIAYLRVLQTTRTGIENVPSAERDRLRNVPKPAPKAVPEAPPAAPAPTTEPANQPASPTGTPGGTTK